MALDAPPPQPLDPPVAAGGVTENDDEEEITNEIEEFLRFLGLVKYTKIFIDNQIDDLDTLQSLEENELADYIPDEKERQKLWSYILSRNDFAQ
eukprot:TRINITY_DN883_c0_g1_i1.p1 TRINITY_DN883_c0_g1~~TRINITY_DN883_c0_g1_i1.p1  ORF type:complete len:94 (-),score=37.76 TRINITY_DN883_c0_g1_i1:240-521(-)